MKRVLIAGMVLAAVMIAGFWGYSRRVPEKDQPTSLAAETERRPAGSESPRAPSPILSVIPSPLPRSTSEAARPSKRVPAVESLEAYLSKKYPGEWNLQSDEHGKVFSILGGVIPEAGKSAESAARLVKELAPFLGVSAGNIQASAVKAEEGPRTTSYDFPEFSQGFAVFDGRVTVLSRNSDGGVYMVNSDLKPVDPVNTKISLSVEEARRILEHHYSKKKVKAIRPGSERPVIWAEAKPHELAWFFIVEISGSDYDRLQVLVGIQSASVLLERSTVFH